MTDPIRGATEKLDPHDPLAAPRKVIRLFGGNESQFVDVDVEFTIGKLIIWSFVHRLHPICLTPVHGVRQIGCAK